jgi:hypothetical protein
MCWHTFILHTLHDVSCCALHDMSCWRVLRACMHAQEALRLKESKAVDEVVAVSLGPQQVQVRGGAQSQLQRIAEQGLLAGAATAVE